MSKVDDAAKKVLRAATKKTPRSAAVLADKAGYSSGRAISRAIGQLTASGQLVWKDKGYVKTA